MSKRDWIRDHRQEIDEAIRAGGYDGTINDSDREDWILNDQFLYSWARRAGVNI